MQIKWPSWRSVVLSDFEHCVASIPTQRNDLSLPIWQEKVRRLVPPLYV